jgi:hypothetical protein
MLMNPRRLLLLWRAAQMSRWQARGTGAANVFADAFPAWVVSRASTEFAQLRSKKERSKKGKN